jgi:hypothetical protein
MIFWPTVFLPMSPTALLEGALRCEVVVCSFGYSGGESPGACTNALYLTERRENGQYSVMCSAKRHFRKRNELQT